MAALTFKSIILTGMVAVASCAMAQNPTSPFVETMPGPVVAASESTDSLPENATQLINRDFPDAHISGLTKNFMSGNYEATLSDGSVVTVDRQGQLISIEAAPGTSISGDVLKLELPAKAYRELADMHCVDSVSILQFTDGTPRVVLNNITIGDLGLRAVR